VVIVVPAWWSSSNWRRPRNARVHWKIPCGCYFTLFFQWNLAFLIFFIAEKQSQPIHTTILHVSTFSHYPSLPSTTPLCPLRRCLRLRQSLQITSINLSLSITSTTTTQNVFEANQQGKLQLDGMRWDTMKRAAKERGYGILFLDAAPRTGRESWERRKEQFCVKRMMDDWCGTHGG
jgi:hypothetical protein